jgi:hypothetical protein
MMRLLYIVFLSFLFTCTFTVKASAQVCNPPDSLSLVMLKADTIVVSWLTVPGATDYEVAYGANPYTPPAHGTLFSFTVAQFSGLTPNTTYDICVRSVCDTQFSTWRCRSFTTPTGVSHYSKREKALLQAWPSPVKNILNLDIPVAITRTRRITITNIIGTQVYTTSNVQARMTVDVTTWSPGIYFVKYADDNATHTVKILKQ